MMLHLAYPQGHLSASEHVAHSVLATVGRRYAHGLLASRQILSPRLPLVGWLRWERSGRLLGGPIEAQTERVNPHGGHDWSLDFVSRGLMIGQRSFSLPL